ncbi:hypothetical protein MYAM1_003280 [Malassezia yamatoensis]|uniref:Nuclear rim protein 1 n=1 Tax=Malassezia yamatoensis TaxID=253288 RepID=A0AAJ5YUL2_9BASI|nr:hypothetical protein MYAM1_003280 [Malassezia yamatoensis]
MVREISKEAQRRILAQRDDHLAGSRAKRDTTDSDLVSRNPSSPFARSADNRRNMNAWGTQTPPHERSTPTRGMAMRTPHKIPGATNMAMRTPHNKITEPSVTQSPLQRKGAYFSPARFSSNTNSSEESVPDAKPNTWKASWREWLLEQFPGILQSLFQSLEMELDQAIMSPDLGVPAAIVLHALSLLSQLMLPNSSFTTFSSTSTTNAEIRNGNRVKKPLFTSNRRTNSQKSYSAYLGQVLARQRRAALSYTSRLLSLALLSVAVYNTYLLFSRKRTYRLWHKRENIHQQDERLREPGHNSHSTSHADNTSDLAMSCGRQIPVLEWLIPPAPIPEAKSAQEQVYTLRMWDPLDAPLYLFSLYSPAHAIWWIIAGSWNLGPVTTWILTVVILGLVSSQTYYLAEQFTALLRDRQVVSAEVLREYDEKFVLPRAMPLVRDASTMTD